MAYPPEAVARIKELEQELAELKKTRVVILDRAKLDELGDLTNLSWEPYHSRISWISRAAVCCRKGESEFNSRVRTFNQISYEETKEVAKCASEIVDVLLKYARQIKQEGENE